MIVFDLVVLNVSVRMKETMFLDGNDINVVILCIFYKFVKTGWWIQCSSVERAYKGMLSTCYDFWSRSFMVLSM